MAITIRQTHELGDDEILALSRENPGYQFERDREGRLVVTPAGGQSGRRSGQVFAQLLSWAQARHAGPVFDSSTGFRLPDESLLSPDAAWIRKERWDALNEEQREGFPPLSPDAVFEVRSQSESIEELRVKLRRYVENGARVAVLIDPYARNVEVLRRDGFSYPTHDVVQFDEDLPGFTLDVRSLD
jgi:Uma2 family endonuclease